jgi:hypothetical protein
LDSLDEFAWCAWVRRYYITHRTFGGGLLRRDEEDAAHASKQAFDVLISLRRFALVVVPLSVRFALV